MKKLKKISNILYGLVIALLLFVIVSSYLSYSNNPLGIRTYVVQSGSMQPTISVGSMVFVKAQPTYQENDIITFYTNFENNSKDNKFTTTHRVVFADIRTMVGAKSSYVTKGDANNAPDVKPVPESFVIGKVVLAVPLVGYLMSLIRTQLGFIFLVVVPATLIVYSEAQNIKREIQKMLANRNTIKVPPSAEVEVFSEKIIVVEEPLPKPTEKPKRPRKPKKEISK